MTRRLRSAVLLTFALAHGAVGLAQRGAPVAQTVPLPASSYGFEPGTDRKLADFAQITDYFRKLDAASDRVQVFSIGKTAEGREMILAAISSEANLQRLARYRDIAKQLALARGLTDESARVLAREGRAIVWIDFGLHATEVAHAQVSTEVAHAVATSESEEMRRIRDQVIFVTVPVMNPDGLDIVTSWYREHVGTPFETSPLPVLYQKHAGHDNNRDWYMQNLPETRNVTRQLYQEWHPQLLYNQHQSGVLSPRIWTPPMDDPANPNMHPLVNRGINLLGVGIQQRLEQEGKTGAQGYSTYSNWWNGGMRSTPCFHNIVGILTETASGRYATPVEVAPDDLPRMLASGERATEPSIWNASPWKGGIWRLRDQMDYMFTASMAVLRMGADYREDWLYNRYQMARDQIAAGAKGGPYAYVIPPTQHDWPTAIKMARTLQMGAVDVHRATAPFTAGTESYPAGTLVVFMAQPFRGYTKDLLEAQHHPDRRQGTGGPPKRPYDMAGWTLSYQMGVRADAIDAPFTAAVELVSDVTTLLESRSATPAPTAAAVKLDRRANDAVRAALQLVEQGVPVHLTQEAFIVSGPDAAARTTAVARPLGLEVTVAPAVAGRRLARPRVGLYKSFVAAMDEGWTRFVLEQFGVPYESLQNADVRAGQLRSRFETIVLPDQGLDDMLNGHAPGSMPASFTGGIGVEGATALRLFVEQGGTLLAIDDATALPLQMFGLPIRNALDGVRNTEFYSPGSLLRLRVDVTANLAAGMPEEQAAFFVNGRAFDLGRPNRRGGEGGDDAAGGGPDGIRVLARYAEKNLLMSGWINGERFVAGKPAAVEARLGNGRVVLVGFGLQFRGQPHGTFKLLLNPILDSATERAAPPSAGAPERERTPR